MLLLFVKERNGNIILNFSWGKNECAKQKGWGGIIIIIITMLINYSKLYHTPAYVLYIFFRNKKYFIIHHDFPRHSLEVCAAIQDLGPKKASLLGFFFFF